MKRRKRMGKTPRKLQTLLLLLFGIGALVSTNSAQSGQQRVFAKSPPGGLKCRTIRPVLNSVKPIVFLTFVRETSIQNEQKAKDYLVFRLTNNACVPIIIDMSGASPDLGDASLYYNLTNSRTGEILGDSKSCHVCSSNQLGPGRGITFAVPKDVISRDRDLSIEFEFTREVTLGNFPSWTQHNVFFSLGNLPESVKLGG